jgi:OPA family glycerol-3-phosphate transporter-like MFS transporter
MVAKRQSVRWDWVTVFLMFLGYSGYYLCRSNFSVAKPFLLAEYPGVITKDVLGSIASISILFYAGGKFLFGSLADLFRGKRLFLFGMIGAIICTVLLGVGGPPVFLLAVCSNRLVQSSGWVGMVKITSRWFGGNHYGRAMAFMSF